MRLFESALLTVAALVGSDGCSVNVSLPRNSIPLEKDRLRLLSNELLQLLFVQLSHGISICDRSTSPRGGGDVATGDWLPQKMALAVAHNAMELSDFLEVCMYASVCVLHINNNANRLCIFLRLCAACNSFFPEQSHPCLRI